MPGLQALQVAAPVPLTPVSKPAGQLRGGRCPIGFFGFAARQVEAESQVAAQSLAMALGVRVFALPKTCKSILYAHHPSPSALVVCGLCWLPRAHGAAEQGIQRTATISLSGADTGWDSMLCRSARARLRQAVISQLLPSFPALPGRAPFGTNIGAACAVCSRDPSRRAGRACGSPSGVGEGARLARSAALAAVEGGICSGRAAVQMGRCIGLI